jgi:hypothetical protein
MSESDTDSEAFAEQSFEIDDDDGNELPPLVKLPEISGEDDDELIVVGVDDEPEPQPEAQFDGVYRFAFKVVGGDTDVIRDVDRRPLVEGEEYAVRTSAKTLWRDVQRILEENGSLAGVGMRIARADADGDVEPYEVEEVDVDE